MKMEQGRRQPWGSAVKLCECSFPDVMMPSYSRNPWSCVFFIVYLSIELYFIMNLVSEHVSRPPTPPLEQASQPAQHQAPQGWRNRARCGPLSGMGSRAVVKCGVVVDVLVGREFSWLPVGNITAAVSTGAQLLGQAAREPFILQ